MSCKTSNTPIQVASSGETVALEKVNIQSPWDSFRGSSAKEFIIEHVTLDLTVDFEKRQVLGTSELVLAPHFYDQELLVLDAKKMGIQQVYLDGNRWNLYEYDSSQLYIELPRPLTAGEQLVCEVTFEINQFAVPAQAAAENKGGIFMVDYWPERSPQLWTQGETAFTSHWYPTIDQPNQRYTQQVSLTVADRYTTLSNGVLRSQVAVADGWRKDTWLLNQPHAPYLSMIAVGDYEEIQLDTDQMPAKVLAADTDIEGLQQVFSRTYRMIDFFEQRFGVSYPWPAYHQIVAKDYISGAMENTGAVVFLEDIAISEQEQEYLHFDDYISHELAHHWFGNLVTCESWAHLALNESFATYSEQLWNEYYYGQDSADFIAQRELTNYLREAERKKENLIRHYYDDADADLFDNHSYSKGSRILNMLRNYVGDEAFFASVSHYLTKHQFNDVEVADLRLSFEEITGLDLIWFFQQWMHNPGHPVLQLEHKLANDTLFITVEQQQELASFPLYVLPMYVDVYWGDEALTYPLTIANQHHTFRIPAQGRSLAGIQFDPDFQLVGEVTHKRTAEELMHQALHAEDLLSRLAAYDGLLSAKEEEEVLDARLVNQILLESNEAVLVTYLDLLDQTEAVDWQPHSGQLLKLSQHPHPQVRSAAYLILERLPSGVDWEKVYKTDSSNYVKGLALESLLRTKGKEFGQLVFDSLQASDDLNFILPLTFFINEANNGGLGEWYQQKINALKSPDQLYLIAAYNDYLLEASQIEKLAARSFFLRYAKYHIESDTRMVAFEGLLLLSDAVDISRQVEEILSFERDQQLLALYRDFYPE